MICKDYKKNVCNDYEIILKIHAVPAEDTDAAELEIYDILKACNQLPYDFDLQFKKVGEWL